MIRNQNQPKIWVYNAGIDRNWQKKSCGVRKVNDQSEQKLFNSQGELVLLLAGKNDVVFLANQPDEEFLKDIGKFGCERPCIKVLSGDEQTMSEVLQVQNDIWRDFKNKESFQYVPYILSACDEEICKREGLSLYGSDSETVKKINNKMTARKIVEGLKLPVVKGYLCSSREALIKAHESLRDLGHEKFAIKEPYNSAGKGVYFIKDEKQFQTFARMMRFPENEEFEVSIEEWCENKRDINYQIEITPEGKVELLALTEQIINVTSYKGTIYPVDLTQEQKMQYEEYAQKIGKELYRLGFYGLVGIDSMIKENGDIIPAIEFNARLNQSTFYLPVIENLHSRGRKTLIRGYDVQTDKKLTYPLVKEILRERNLYFSEDTNEGVLILNSAGLSVYRDNKYHSRMLFGIAFGEEKTVDAQYEVLENFVKYIQTL